MQFSVTLAIRFVRQIIIAAIVAIILWSALTLIFENHFIFFPEKYSSSEYAESEQVPGLIDCWPVTDDGVRLHGWYLRADSAIATLVIAHGNAGNISHRLDLLVAIRRAGFNVFMFDYRGYGRSEGSPDEDGIYRDGLAAFDFVHNLTGIDTQRIIFWGTSLGGAVAVEVATRKRVAGLILESTFTSASDMAGVHYPYLPSRFILRAKLNSIDKIAKIHVPLLIIHGGRDRTVPFRLGKQLFDAANEPKEFFEIPSADHNDTYVAGGTAYFHRLRKFVVDNLPSQKH